MRIEQEIRLVLPSPPGPRRWRAPALRGARPREAFRAVTHAALEQIEANARGVTVSSDPEFLHQLRVGMRRLRAALRAFRAALPAKATKALRRSLRRISSTLGRARDWDVLLARLEAGAGSQEILARARARRREARQAARRTIRSRTFAQALEEARAIVPAESTKPLAQFGAAALARAQRKLMKQARGLDWRDAGERHALRIRAKRLRYGCEFFAPAFPARRAALYLAELKELQEILGELNDIAVGRRLIGFEADESALLRRLGAAWGRFARRPVFWRAAG